MTLSLSNGATVSLSSNENDRTELIGTYTIDADDDDANSDSPLTVLAYTAGTTADVSGNLLEVSDASAVDNITAHVIDTTAPTATLASAGHQYDVSTGTLTLAGTNLVSLLSDPADTNVKGVLDFTKLTWNVDAAGSVSMTMSEMMSRVRWSQMARRSQLSCQVRAKRTCMDWQVLVELRQRAVHWMQLTLKLGSCETRRQ